MSEITLWYAVGNCLNFFAEVRIEGKTKNMADGTPVFGPKFQRIFFPHCVWPRCRTAFLTTPALSSNVFETFCMIYHNEIYSAELQSIGSLNPCGLNPLPLKR